MCAAPDNDPTLFVIGAPWPWDPGLVAQPGFGWHPDPGMLLLAEDQVTEEMCNDLAGPVDAALIAHGPLVGLLVRFSGGWDQWMETMIWRYPGDSLPEGLTPTQNRDERLLFKVVLVDCSTSRIAHIRAFTVSPHMTRAIQREVNDRWGPESRWANGVTNEEAMVYRREWEQKHPTTSSALKASMARSHGGD